MALLGACGDGNLSVCIGDAQFCRKALAQNQPPTADAGEDRRVAPLATVSLDGSASSDRDGSIASYSWAQTSGTGVTIRDGDRAVAEFDAPDTAEVETLTFRLTVVDDDSAADEDQVAITVDPLSQDAVRGVNLLTRSVAPVPVETVAPCSPVPANVTSANEALAYETSAYETSAYETSAGRWHAEAGLWLLARAAALGRDPDPDAATRFLDAGRALLAHAGDLPPPDGLAAGLWHTGLVGLERYADSRDPALATLAGQLSRPPSAAVQALTVDVLTGRATPVLAGPATIALIPTDPATARAAAARRLSAASCADAPDLLRVAADTALLVLGNENL